MLWPRRGHSSPLSLAGLSGWLIVYASEQPPILHLMTSIVGVRFFGIGHSVLRYQERLKLHDAVFESTDRLRIRLWNGLLQRPAAWRRLARGGGALERLVGDVDELRDVAPRAVSPRWWACWWLRPPVWPQRC